MEAGQIVRIGKIAFDDLDQEFRAYVTLDGIIERKSKDLKRRKDQLESEVECITAGVARAERILDAFRRLDEIIQKVKENEGEVEDLTQRKNKQAMEIQALGQNIEKLRTELKAFEDAWAIRRKFMRKPETIQAEILRADGKIAQASAEIAKLDARIADVRRGMAELDRSFYFG